MNWGNIIGYVVSTVLLFYLQKKMNKSNNDNQMDPAKSATDGAEDQIGNVIPAALGRVLIKSPMISFYGEFRADPYREEYGLHTKWNWLPILISGLIQALVVAFAPKQHQTSGPIGGGQSHIHYVNDTENGKANQLMMIAIQTVLNLILSYIFYKHQGKVTIQKGFCYYLGWQNIICWSSPYIGLKRIWMNVYDTEVQDSTEQGVWESDVATYQNNPTGISAYIEDREMFGGPDEGGGFVGDIRVYFGGFVQPLDPWMVYEMTISENVPANLKGLTPKYPMFLTCVISDKNLRDGAYIGKQATVPEMWFEVTNYPNHLGEMFAADLRAAYRKQIEKDMKDLHNFATSSIPPTQLPNYLNLYNALQATLNRLVDLQATDSTDTTTIDSLKKQADTQLDNLKFATPSDLLSDFSTYSSPLSLHYKHGRIKLGRLGDDLNPAEAIYEILMNKNWGCHYTDDRVDLYSLVDIGATTELEGLGVSVLIDQIREAKEYIDKILNHINAVRFDNPFTGKLTFVAIRNDYRLDEIKSFDISNTSELEFTRLDWSETYSSMEAKFTDADDKYNESTVPAHDASNRLITGEFKQKQIDATYYTTPSNAFWYAQTALLPAAYPLSALTLKCNRYGYDVLIGDAIKVTWEPYGINQQIYRVTDVDYATLTEGEVTITALEDVFGFDRLDLYAPLPPTWENVKILPTPITFYMFFELPYEGMNSKDTYIYTLAVQPAFETIYYYIWRDIQGNFVKTATTNGWNIGGRCVLGYPEAYDDDTNGFELSLLTISHDAMDLFVDAVNNDRQRYNNMSGNTLLYIDDEILSYDTIEKLPNGNYQIKGIIRGVYDTIPQNHTANATVFFINNPTPVETKPICYEGSTSTERLGLSTGTASVSDDLDVARAVTFETRRRSEAPSIMADLQYDTDRGDKINYQYEHNEILGGDLSFTFKNRNKFVTAGILHQHDTDFYGLSIEPSQDVYAEIKVTSQDGYDSVSLTSLWDLSINEPIDIVKYKWADFCKDIQHRVRVENNVTVEVSTYDDSINVHSYCHYTKNVTLRIPEVCGIIEPIYDSITGDLDEAQTFDAVKAYTDNICGVDMVYIPQSPYITNTAIPYNQCPIVILGTPTSFGIMGQDGNSYDLLPIAYRVDGINSIGDSVLHKIELEDYYIFGISFNDFTNNYTDYYQQLGGAFNSYTPYVV